MVVTVDTAVPFTTDREPFSPLFFATISYFMVFSSLFFLFCFLPVVLLSYYVLPVKLRNLHLLLASLFFYAWGEGVYVVLMLSVVLINYALGIHFERTSGPGRRLWLASGVSLNLLPLLYYKYFEFFLASMDEFFPAIALSAVNPEHAIHLPLGISFFTFQALSYLIDTYRRTTPAQKNPINLGLYIALFPQLIAGPIVRYHDIALQIARRRVTPELFTSGVERFMVGLAKKVLLANTLGQMADIVFGIPSEQLSTAAIWIGATSYMLQIYYDFSGYSDMAIGLGRMFGFTFLENFNYPYIARSIQEFWRRWHISLSNWFRDYLYIPLGGNRQGGVRTITNLFVVFFLCGLWHGASWNFVFWGLFHGFFLALERGYPGQMLRRLPSLFRHLYVLFIVLIGWIFFRAESFDQGAELTAVLLGDQLTAALPYNVVLRMDPLFVTTFIIAVIFMFPVVPALLKRFDAKSPAWPGTIPGLAKCVHRGGLFMVFILSIASLATGVYNPFIYFRF